MGNLLVIKHSLLSEKLHVINGHQGFVKGLTWDPVGKYLASQVLSLKIL
jgi:protein HIRA/HIR1